MTESELKDRLSNSNNAHYREEFIREWIETEILSQLAEEKKLLNKKNYNKILESSGKELAASIAINEYLLTHEIKYSDSDLLNFYRQHKTDYSFSQDAYILNYITFADEESAIKFRNAAISEDWQNSVDNLDSTMNVVANIQNQIFKVSEIQSKRIMRVVQKLFKNEISLVVNTELNNFVVVQQIDKIDQNTVPKFNYVKNNVRKSFINFNQRKEIRSYLDSLIAQKRVKIY